MKLRGYQADALQNVAEAYQAGKRRVVLTMPTGAGKTVTAAAMAQTAVEGGRRVLMLVHRQELLRQAEKAMKAADLQTGVVWKKREETKADVVITTIQSRKKLEKYDLEDFIIVDECHHAVSPTWKKRLEEHPARVLGLTATPARRDGRGLREVFDELVIGRRVDELIAEGSLCNYRLLAPPGGYDMRGARWRMGDFALESSKREAKRKMAAVLDAVNTYARERRSLIFCVDIAHAEETRDKLRKIDYSCELLTGETSDKERHSVEQDFREGRLQGLLNVDLFGEGYDCPECDCVVLARPTESLSLYLQQIGRAMRPAPGKTEALIIDCARNSSRLGLPDDRRKWSLDSEKRNIKDREPALWTCPACSSGNRPGTIVCKYCGYEREVNYKAVNEEPAILIEIANTQGLGKAEYMAKLHGQTVAYAALRFPDDMQAALELVERLGREAL